MMQRRLSKRSLKFINLKMEMQKTHEIFTKWIKSILSIAKPGIATLTAFVHTARVFE